MNREQLRNISPAKLQIILEIMEASKGKGSDMIMPLLLHANQQMQQQGLSFTPEESNLIIQLLKEDMSPSEVRKLDMMQSILQSYSHS
jgi:hypothetical protein